MFESEEEIRRIVRTTLNEEKAELVRVVKSAIAEETRDWHHVSPQDHYEDHRFISQVRRWFDGMTKGVSYIVLAVVIFALLGMAVVGLGSEMARAVFVKLLKLG